MSGRSMALLGGGASAAVLAVLGLTLLIGGTNAPRKGVQVADSQPAKTAPARPAPTGSGSPPPGVPGSPAPAAPITVPPVAGLPSMTAVSRLTAQRIPLGGVIRVPSSRPAGLVLRSYPPGGSSVQPGGSVTLYVSAGLGGSVTGSNVVVPYFVGQSEAEARSSAAGLGLRIVVTNDGTTVVSQQPEPGSVRLRGSTITLVLR